MQWLQSVIDWFMNLVEEIAKSWRYTFVDEVDGLEYAVVSCSLGEGEDGYELENPEGQRRRLSDFPSEFQFRNMEEVKRLCQARLDAAQVQLYSPFDASL